MLQDKELEEPQVNVKKIHKDCAPVPCSIILPLWTECELMVIEVRKALKDFP